MLGSSAADEEISLDEEIRNNECTEEDNDADAHVTAREITAAAANNRGRIEEGLPPETAASDFWHKMGAVIQEANDALWSQVQAAMLVLANKQKATEKEVAALQTQQTAMRGELDKLKASAATGALSSAPGFADSATSTVSGSGKFSPQYVEFRGVCTFAEKMTKGAMRPEVDAWVTSLKEKIPEHVRVRMGRIRMVGGKVHTFGVEIAGGGEYCWEAKELITEQLQDHPFRDTTILRINVERHPDAKARFGIFGEHCRALRQLIAEISTAHNGQTQREITIEDRWKNLSIHLTIDGVTNPEPLVRVQVGKDVQYDEKQLQEGLDLTVQQVQAKVTEGRPRSLML